MLLNFLKKSRSLPDGPKHTQNGPKLPKYQVFRIFLENGQLDFSGFLNVIIGQWCLSKIHMVGTFPKILVWALSMLKYAENVYNHVKSSVTCLCCDDVCIQISRTNKF